MLIGDIKGKMNTEKLLTRFPSISANEELSKHCTFMIGGPADYFYRCKDSGELQELIKTASELQLPYFIFGGGSNILFDDGGFRGLVIKIETSNINIEGNLITADSGVMASKLIKASVDNGLSGLEKWIGLPGTVGGAVRGNAGCNGLETKDVLVEATVLDPQTGKLEVLEAKDLNFSYRNSKLKETGHLILDATFKLDNADISSEKQQEIMKEINSTRLEKQPIGRTTGSFFKNPSSDNPAGMLIEKAGLKGKTIGKAMISEKHGNFFLNLGGATSKDVKALAKLARAEVEARFDLILEEEVQILSEHGKEKL